MLTGLCVAVMCAAAVFAQPKQPKPKSQKELDALIAVQNAATDDARIAAIENVLTKFADTEFKPGLLMMAAATYQQKGDMDNMTVYAERSLEADPHSFQAMLMLASGYATRTREFDLDKEDKLAKAEGYAKKAMTELQTAEKPRADLTDEQWAAAKKQLVAQAHEVLGTSAMVRKKYDVAISEYSAALKEDPTPDTTTMVRLASAYNANNQPDLALPLCEKVMATADAPARVKSVAQAERVRATQLKQKNAGPAAPAAKPAESAPAPQPVKP
jgi:tetratricopeptide (TPR) repeat protein